MFTFYDSSFHPMCESPNVDDFVNLLDTVRMVTYRSPEGREKILKMEFSTVRNEETATA